MIWSSFVKTWYACSRKFKFKFKFNCLFFGVKSLYILRRPQNFAKSPPYFCLQYIKTKVGWRFHKILWPSQNIWTLYFIDNLQIFTCQIYLDPHTMFKYGPPKLASFRYCRIILTGKCQGSCEKNRWAWNCQEIFSVPSTNSRAATTQAQDAVCQYTRWSLSL